MQTTIDQMNHRELALGSRGRSGGTVGHLAGGVFAGGADGYPKPIWDKESGGSTGGRRVLAGHYDLGHILTRDWATLGPKVNGKLHIYVGDRDNYFLNERLPGRGLPQDAHRSDARRRSRLRSRGPSTAGTATMPGPTPCRGCATRRCSFPDHGPDPEEPSLWRGHIELAVLGRAVSLTREDVRAAVERAGDAHWQALIRHHEDPYPRPAPTPGDVSG